MIQIQVTIIAVLTPFSGLGWLQSRGIIVPSATA